MSFDALADQRFRIFAEIGGKFRLGKQGRESNK